jgi:putative DNA primase/helicase
LCDRRPSKWRSEISHWFTGRDVVILPDNDPVGRVHGQDVARKLSGIAGRIRVLDLPGLLEKGDVSDWIAAGGTADELERLAEAAPEWLPGPEPGRNKDGEIDHLIIKSGDTLQMQKIEWLWPGWLARGKFHLIAGKAAPMSSPERE